MTTITTARGAARAGAGTEGPTRYRWRASTLWHLVWLANVPLTQWFDPTSTLVDYLLAVALAAAFIPFYLAAYQVPRLARWAPAITTGLAAITTFVNPGAVILFVYAAAFAGTFLPRRTALRWLVVATLLIVAHTALSAIPFPWVLWAFTPSAILTWIIGIVTIEQQQDEREARLHSARIEHLAMLAERERIARDLHDLLGHALTGIVVRAQLAQRLTPRDTEAAVAEMAEIERAARSALSEVRATVAGWRQVAFDDELAAARDALTAAGVELDVVREPDLTFTPTVETALGLALREAVTNVVRHAHARRCTVALRRIGGEVVLEVADDGIGGSKTEGTGLTGMRERISALGGEVRREVSGGCRLRVSVPAEVAT